VSSLVAPDPPAGLSSGLRPLYAEAVSVADASPASASALLRMLIQTLIKGQGLRGRDLVRDIGTLVERGAPVGLLRALDVIGMSEHESRHPAELSLANGHSDAQNLFMFVNLFVTQILGT
jgi:hypothetical protein